MAVLNKNLTKLDSGGTPAQTQNEIELRKAAYSPSVVAQAQTTNTSEVSDKYSDKYLEGQQARENAQNGILAYGAIQAHNAAMQRYGWEKAFQGMSDWLAGRFGNKNPINPDDALNRAAVYGQIAANPKEAREKLSTSTTPTTTPTTPSNGQTTDTTDTATNTGALSGSPSNDNPYSDYLKNERNYQLQQLGNERNNAVQRARLAYQKAINPYGVQAEALAASGLSPNGGYGQRMQTARYNAYADALNAADNQYQSDVAALDRQLAYQQYQTEQSEKQNAYTDALNQLNYTTSAISTGLSIAQSLKDAKQLSWKGKKLTDESVALLKQRLSSSLPYVTDQLVDTIIQMLAK